ncbi:MAG: SLC13 family permease [Candidatus Eisenbacteria bacterium]
MTPDILTVLLLLAATIILLVSERLRVDLIAIIVMIALAWLRLLTPAEAFSGLASNAVVAVGAVMIMGFGIERSGVTLRLTRGIIKAAGTSERRLVGLVSAVVGVLSGFMQNVGAAVLFLPAMLRISRRTRIPVSRLLMPMGFAAILGGTITMVGSGPLIILNDLLKRGGEAGFGIFSVTPVGLALLASGILYFLVLGRAILPPAKAQEPLRSSEQELIEAWQLPSTIYRFTVPVGSSIVGKSRDELDLWGKYGINLLALEESGDVHYAPWRHTRLAAGQRFAVLGRSEDVTRFCSDHGLACKEGCGDFSELDTGGSTGFAEAIVPPRSPIAGKSVREIALRKNFNVEPIMLLRGELEDRGDFSDVKLRPGDALIIHGQWSSIRALGDRRNFVLSSAVEGESSLARRPILALACFVGALVLAFSGVQLSHALLTGAVAMVLLRVITIDEAYHAVDWRTVFLLAGLIPLGLAMEKTGAAAFVAGNIMRVMGDFGPFAILLAVGVLSTFFSLFMSNVAATVVLVPLVLIVSRQAGVDPRGAALLVAVCASNSFVLPTHQVNALLMAPGGYRNADYLRAGGIMTGVFLLVACTLIYVLFI